MARDNNIVIQKLQNTKKHGKNGARGAMVFSIHRAMFDYAEHVDDASNVACPVACGPRRQTNQAVTLEVVVLCCFCMIFMFLWVQSKTGLWFAACFFF